MEHLTEVKHFRFQFREPFQFRERLIIFLVAATQEAFGAKAAPRNLKNND